VRDLGAVLSALPMLVVTTESAAAAGPVHLGGRARPPLLRGRAGGHLAGGRADAPERQDADVVPPYEDTPEICDYEHYDYQTRFWEQGDRAYEDAVEAVALRRLLPRRGGRLLLELGAGAGRNSMRYPQFGHVVLLDYARTQLDQARRRLGDDPRYTYVAGDIYRLPFAAGVFDGATMIRTLHHMIDACRALTEVRRTLQPDAALILEFPNKHNLKSMVRYALHGQSWSPYSPEPLEYAPLNFDFHPATVRSWLYTTGFRVERALTVSHFRLAWMKHHVRLRLLVEMDSLAQLTGDWWQVSPSVLLRARATGPSERPGLGAFFRCPACGCALPDTPPTLACGSCGAIYPVQDGIYDLRLPRATRARPLTPELAR
jgi:ubiquinone/menaquinone biosynthesis C-methylase UbiE